MNLTLRWITRLAVIATGGAIVEAADGCKLCPSLSRVCPRVIATMPAAFDCAYLDAFALSLRSVRDDSAACEADITSAFCTWLSKVADSNQQTQCAGGLADLAATAKMCPDDCSAIAACLSVPAMWNCSDTFYASSSSSPVCAAIDILSSSSSSSGGSLVPNDTIAGSLGSASDPASSAQSIEHNLWFVLFLVTSSILVLCAGASGLYARRLLKQRRVATENLARASYMAGDPLSVQIGGDVVPTPAAGGSRTPRSNALSPPLRALSPRLLAASSAAGSPLARPAGADARSPNPASPTAGPNDPIMPPSGSPFAVHLQQLSYPAASPSPSPISPPPRCAMQSPTGYEMSRCSALGSPSGFNDAPSRSPPPLSSPPPPARSMPPPPPPPTASRPQQSPKARAGFQRVDG